jgi:hypothetical protein
MTRTRRHISVTAHLEGWFRLLDPSSPGGQGVLDVLARGDPRLHEHLAEVPFDRADAEDSSAPISAFEPAGRRAPAARICVTPCSRP